MGNRAVISLMHASDNSTAPCIYVHWNGGLASIEGFLAAARRVDLPADTEALYNLIRGYLGSSAYLETWNRADKDNLDNGTYIISDDWRIVKRLFTRGREERDPEKTQAIADHCAQVWCMAQAPAA